MTRRLKSAPSNLELQDSIAGAKQRLPGPAWAKSGEEKFESILKIASWFKKFARPQQNFQITQTLHANSAYTFQALCQTPDKHTSEVVRDELFTIGS
mmetsp:Transcript_53644/g.160602  ORF Transcript_53644/g.160602 Transcript_53644/m.160602 type:complete len:97 (-) Transcript_53644:2253-2543(-)